MTIILEKIKNTPLYSEELGIALSRKREQEYFKWFLASVLFGGRISESIARNTYYAFVRYKLLTPQRILEAGWDFLVNPIMREGGYVRYDGRKSSQILRNCETLLLHYAGRLTKLYEAAADNQDLEARLLAFYGIGPITINIFLRELRPYWPNADPEPLPIVTELAAQHGLDLAAYDRKTITFARIEAGLIRQRRRLKRDAAKQQQADFIHKA